VNDENALADRGVEKQSIFTAFISSVDYPLNSYFFESTSAMLLPLNDASSVLILTSDELH